MIGNLKLKIKSSKEDGLASRRIKTEMVDNSKKITVVSNKARQPLAEHRKNGPELYQYDTRKSKPLKSFTNKPIAVYSKLNTEANDRDSINQGQKVAMQKVFNDKNEIWLNNPSKQSSRMSGACRYVVETKVGSGTFGVVHKARDRKTLEMVAIKRVFQDKKYKNRQLQILKILNHPCVLKIRDSFYTYEGDKEYLNVVMDYFPTNLYESIQRYRNKGEISRLKLKALSYQLFRGLLYLGTLGIAHRDMKPQNVLVNDENWKLIICDFGSAKKLVAGEANLAYICSRCYRAPELIFGSTGYTPQIDMWSAGCIILEMLTLEPVFRADSNIDQLVQIIKILGTPSHQEMLEMNPQCEIDKYHFPKINARTWQKILKNKNLGDDFYDLITKVLRYSPDRRLTPFQALMHPFFNELREEQVFMKLRKQYNIGDLFDYHLTKEASAGELSGLVPNWYKQ